MSDTDTPITEDTPLRLARAAEIAFPGGGITAKGLRREAERGRLVIERIAGKDYTTLRDIAEMRKLCRLVPKQLSQQHEAEPLLADAKEREKLQPAADEKPRPRRLAERERNALRDCFFNEGQPTDLRRYGAAAISSLQLLEYIAPVDLGPHFTTTLYAITPAGQTAWRRKIRGTS